MNLNSMFGSNRVESSVFIPGLGGESSLNKQRRYINALNLIRRKKHIYFFEPRWESDKTESADDKFNRLVDFIKSREHNPSTLIGVSGGASLAARYILSQAHAIDSAHLVVGKVLGASKIGPDFDARAPALKPTVETVEALFKADPSMNGFTNFSCYVPRGISHDGVLETVDMHFQGAEIVDLPGWQHTPVIVYALARYLHKM